MATDFELLEAWRGGDADAGEQLFERYFERVCRFFYNKVDDGIEDLIQQTFLACVESRDRFRGDSSFFTFLISVARNILRVHYRKRRRDERIDFGSTSVHDLGPSVSAILANKKEQRLLLEALRRIPIDLQIALELYFWENMTSAEIARVLEIPEGTAKSRIRRGKELVRREIANMDESLLNTTVENLENWARQLKAVVPGQPPQGKAKAKPKAKPKP